MREFWKTKPTVWLVSAFLTLAIVGGAAFYYFSRDTNGTIEVRRGEIVEAIYGLGTVRTPRQYEVKIGVSTAVRRVLVEEGDGVRAGTPLVILDPALTFKSPISGVVTLVDAHEAELVTPQKPIVRVEDLSDRYIEVAMEQQGVLRVKKGQSATALFESIRGEKFEGKVIAVYARDQDFLARIQVEGLRENVLPGMTADVAIEVSRLKNALLVPLSALLNGYVIVQRKEGRKKVPLTIGAIDASWAEVKEGDIREGEKVVVHRKAKK